VTALPPDGLPELTREQALAEDFDRLRASFRTSVARERALSAVPDPVPAVRPPDPAPRKSERSDAERDLAAVLASPTWRAGRIVTALPRAVLRRRS
jgi:hypothetical protein